MHTAASFLVHLPGYIRRKCYPGLTGHGVASPATLNARQNPLDSRYYFILDFSILHHHTLYLPHSFRHPHHAVCRSFIPYSARSCCSCSQSDYRKSTASGHIQSTFLSVVYVSLVPKTSTSREITALLRG